MSISVQEAISRGIRVVKTPAKLILISAVTLCALLMILHFSWLELLLPPLGLVSGLIYLTVATPKWKIWAYENVDDIQQLQRSAELAGLLPMQSSENIDSFLSSSQKERLIEQQKRFSTETVFVNDSSIPEEMVFYSGIPNEPLLTLNKSGIQIHPEKLFTWDQVTDERIVQITYSKMSGRTGEDVSAGSNYFLRFEHSQETFEIPLSSLNITVWKLDLLLYTYRGRSTMK